MFYNQRRKAVVVNATGSTGGKMQTIDHNIVGSGRATGQNSKGSSAYSNTLTNSNYTSAITNSINSAMNKQSQQQQQQFTYDMK